MTALINRLRHGANRIDAGLVILAFAGLITGGAVWVLIAVVALKVCK